MKSVWSLNENGGYSNTHRVSNPVVEVDNSISVNTQRGQFPWRVSFELSSLHAPYTQIFGMVDAVFSVVDCPLKNDARMHICLLDDEENKDTVLYGKFTTDGSTSWLDFEAILQLVDPHNKNKKDKLKRNLQIAKEVFHRTDITASDIRIMFTEGPVSDILFRMDIDPERIKFHLKFKENDPID